ncbi:uncharacterized protein LOC110451724 [Mizuhopecten yessoensis]|uniref:ConoCAP n=1 Tax=Mizuhopecten yessoensis TaxID=6573 RepID=A0A210QLB7_MIZYE|nr:uncharacterized protein LOC110451724 [Mizuhopecten yessoensis]OWF49524.1 ConoCAP [Mizuhopecten yessoensis]
MESSTLNMLWHTVLLILMVAVTCNAGRGLDIDEALQQILSENDRESYYPLDNTDLDNSEQAVSDLIRRLQPEDRLSKRVFCNGFRGCRGGKRTVPMKQQRLLPEEPPVQKRPFCNGFFGCANGKRSIGAPLRQPDPAQDEIETVELRKRLFCNSYGCLNGKRSSLYQTLVERLRNGKLDIGQADSNLPIRSNSDQHPILVTTRKSLRQLRDDDDEDEDVSKFPLNASNAAEWCKNCNLLKLIMPQLYAFRTEETFQPPYDTQLVNAAERMSRELMTSDNLATDDNEDMLLPEEAREQIDNFQIDKKCSPMSSFSKACKTSKKSRQRRRLQRKTFKGSP